jgi:hypothetical protein
LSYSASPVDFCVWSIASQFNFGRSSASRNSFISSGFPSLLEYMPCKYSLMVLCMSLVYVVITYTNDHFLISNFVNLSLFLPSFGLFG